jgi:hypothetical protein
MHLAIINEKTSAKAAPIKTSWSDGSSVEDGGSGQVRRTGNGGFGRSHSKPNLEEETDGGGRWPGLGHQVNR